MTQPAPLGPLTPRDIDQLLADLPARQRADVAWAAPAVRKAVNRLLEDELSNDLVVEVAESYIHATKTVLGSVAQVLKHDPRAFGLALQARLTALEPRIQEFFGDTPHAIRLTRAVVTLFIFGAVGFNELIKAIASPGWDAKLEELKDLHVDAGASTQEAGVLRGIVLCAAILDAMDRDVAHDRARLLVERADDEAWPLAWLLANTDVPGIGKIRIPSYFAAEKPAEPAPEFKTAVAKELWEQRLKIEAEGLKPLNADAVDAEVAARRGGRSVG